MTRAFNQTLEVNCRPLPRLIPGWQACASQMFPLAFRNRNRNRNRNRMSRLFDHEKLEVYRASLCSKPSRLPLGL